MESEDYYTSSNFRKLMRGISDAFDAPVKSKDYDLVRHFIMALYSYRYVSSQLDNLII